ncbi:hypothetical protein [Carboxydothermus pertinax]|uniref:hypothetical protein n=1 Tax=Carboxydothermus pertinax TaxID=870242 RepID=UPI00096A7876|nr:hypothetical protein [Carboxydothermus pertinax]
MKKKNIFTMLYFGVFGILFIIILWQQGFRLPKLASLKYLLVYTTGVLGIILIMLGLRRQMDKNHPDDEE